jgi:hypothetical protein
MKKLWLASFLCIFLIAAEMPSALPSSFYGNALNGYAGQPINVYFNDVMVASTQVYLCNGQPVYAVDVPMDGVANGTPVVFKFGIFRVGGGVLYSGTNTQLNLNMRRIVPPE